jgi:hypothetical protein
MKKNGLGFTQPIVNNQMKTIVFHIESGESIESIADIPMNVQLKGMNDYQVMGSAFTYFRRYTLSSMLGLVTDKDIDASGEQTGKRKETITDDRLAAALTKIKDGSYTMEKLKEKFELTPKQLELCM